VERSTSPRLSLEGSARTLTAPATMNTILVAIDGSQRAPGVLARSIAVARTQTTRLVLMRSVGIAGDLPQDLWKESEEPLLNVLRARADEYLAKCESSVPLEMRGGTRVVIGSPWQAICDTAERLGVDLVVIGSHGYSGIDRLLGTTAGKVVNHAPCSVLVVRDTPVRETQES
jgi:nucleotide-binding universal stress UspA family protein